MIKMKSFQKNQKLNNFNNKKIKKMKKSYLINYQFY